MKIFALLGLSLLMGCASENIKTSVQNKLPQNLEEALASSYRTEANRQRDQFRHPKETLEFFGLQPTMTVVEIAPGAGWYAQILAPYLNSQGKYIAAAVPTSVYSGGQAFVEWMAAHPELAAKSEIKDFAPPAQVDFAAENSVDMILTFRNVHNWTMNGNEKAAFASFFKALKPGGILGVVEHRADAKKKIKDKDKSGYLKEARVIALAEKAGFKLVAKSEINGNPKDTRNHPYGVWSLPPSLKGGDKDREKYAEIGESDRMTLKFAKPAK